MTLSARRPAGSAVHPTSSSAASRAGIPLLLKLSLSALLLASVLMRVDVASLQGTISRSDLALLGLAVAVSFAAWLVNTLKWQRLLPRSQAGPGYLELLRLNFIGMFYNLFIPGQVGGEVVKSVKLARAGVGATAAAVSVVSDRVTGLLALFVVGVVGVILSPSMVGSAPSLVPWIAGCGFTLAIASTILLTRMGHAALLAVEKILFDCCRQIGWNLHIDSSIPATSGPLSPALVLVLAVVFQSMAVYANLLLCEALGIPLSFAQLLWIVAAVALVQSLPISVAGLGIREGTYVALLQQQGIDASSALALSLAVFAIQLLMATTGWLLEVRGLLRKDMPRVPGVPLSGSSSQ